MGKHPPSKPLKPGRSPEASGAVQYEVKIDTQPLLKLLDLKPTAPLIEKLEQERGSKLLCLLLDQPAMLRPEMMSTFEQMMVRMGKVDKLDVFLRSTGGITEVPWHIVTLMREFCDTLAVLVAERALSGATHIAIAADELVMTPTARLGSVDPKRQHPLLPKDENGRPIPVSVEELKQCVKFIQEQLGDSYPSQNLALIISELFKYINPLALGALEQSYNLAKLITRKCLQTRKTALDEKHIGDIVEMLASKYYSHGFLISRAEVQSDLRLPVTYPDPKLLTAIMELHAFYLQQFGLQTTEDQQGIKLKLAGILQCGSFGFAEILILHRGNPVGESWELFDIGGKP